MKLRHLLAAVAGMLVAGGGTAGAATPSIAGLEASFSAGTTTCVAEVGAALERIRRSERPGGINAVIEVNPDALDIAAQLDAEADLGGELRPLHCVPTLIKDNFQTADALSTTAGSGPASSRSRRGPTRAGPFRSPPPTTASSACARRRA